MLARRKLEAPPDAGHEPRKGESVREKAFTIKSTRLVGLWVSARRFSIRRKMFSGLCPCDPHRSCEAGSFGSRVNSQPHPSRRKSAGESRSMRRTAHRSAQRLVGRAFEQPRERQRSTWVGEGSTRFEKDQGEFASSALKRCRSAVRRNVIARS